MLETVGTLKAISDFNIHPLPLWGKCHGAQCCWLYCFIPVLFVVVVQSLSHGWLFVTPWTAAGQASLSITNSQSLLKLMSLESLMSSNHLILCRPLLLLPSVFPSIRVFLMSQFFASGWAKYWSFSLTSALPKNTQDWSPLEWIGWISLQSKGLSRVFSNTTVQKHQFFSTQISL